MGRVRFPHAARVVKPADFLRLRKTGRRVGVRHFNAQAAPTERDTARLGLAVSRRVSTDAVRRNRIKRIARESADAHDNATLRADLEALWRRLAARPRD
jgi:ribonuclease P protein component